MKKTIALLMAVLLVAALFAVPVSAGPGNQNYGNVKKVGDSDINMSNGDRDAAWDNALAIPVTFSTEDGTATGTTWVLWSDTAYYFYTEVNDSTPVKVGKPDDGEYFDAWVTDSVEIFVEVEGEAGNLTPTPGGNFGDAAWQFRIDREGMPSSYQRNGAWTDDFLIGTAKNKDRFEWAVKEDGNKYYTKHKITFLGAPKAGELGLSVQINDLLEEGGTAPQIRANEIGGSWNADEFGYVVLVDEPAVVAVVAEPEPEVAAAGGGEAADAEVAPVITAAAPSVKTGDTGMILAVLALILAGVCVFVLRSRKNKA